MSEKVTTDFSCTSVVSYRLVSRSSMVDQDREGRVKDNPELLDSIFEELLFSSRTVGDVADGTGRQVRPLASQVDSD
jgi:hypothetical protein